VRVDSRLVALNDPGLVFLLDGVLSVEECNTEMARMDAEDAHPIRSGAALGTERKNARVILFNAPLADRLYARIHAAVPQLLVGMSPVGCNECIRYYRYRPGDFFKPHQDTHFQRSPDERSLLSVVVYLNGGYTGGDLVFHHTRQTVTPRAGLAAVFGHRMVHESTPLVSGVKYALRSDVMYRTTG
jgi:prolyl 4-hydroxylase